VSGADPEESLVAVTAWLRAQESKDLLRFVAIGSVDDGKSTLIGRLLHDANALHQDQLEAVTRASARGSTRGAGSYAEIDFSLFTDGLVAEREQGITIDVAYRYFATEKRKFVIADTPGHVQYTRNMATGASTADAAIILVDARLGVLLQTRRHAQIAALLGIPHVIACVNKMDLVGFDQSRFESIAADLRGIAAKLGLKSLDAIPVSALAGDNVVTETGRTPWWKGGTLLERLETLETAPAGASGRAFRFPVQIVLRPGIEYRGFAGQIVSGAVSVGDEVVALPSGRRTKVVSVDVAGRDVGTAHAPMSVAVRLADEIDLSRGDMLAHPADPPRATTDVEAELVWMSERALDPNRAYLLKNSTRIVRAVIEVISGTNPETLEPAPATGLALNDIGRVHVRCRAPLFCDPYKVNRATGAFILIDSVTNDTVAAGMIVSTSSTATRSAQVKDTLVRVTPGERRERLGQEGRVVRAIAPSLETARDLAIAIERELFDLGRYAVLVEGGGSEAAEACAAAGFFAVLPATGEALAFAIGDDLTQAKPDEAAGDLARRVIVALRASGASGG
jgi:bifunctional enzyme CysN/CysC/sulfate adenylyltransferase subunit 1